MASERKDSKGRALYQGEYERPDGKYKFSYTENGKRLYLYAPTLTKLREKEKKINRLQIEGIDTYPKTDNKDIFIDFFVSAN